MCPAMIIAFKKIRQKLKETISGYYDTSTETRQTCRAAKEKHQWRTSYLISQVQTAVMALQQIKDGQRGVPKVKFERRDCCIQLK